MPTTTIAPTMTPSQDLIGRLPLARRRRGGLCVAPKRDEKATEGGRPFVYGSCSG